VCTYEARYCEAEVTGNLSRCGVRKSEIEVTYAKNWKTKQKQSDIKKTAFWNTATCSSVEEDRRFRGANCLHHQAAMT
jgi:hypothetical protein